LKFINLVSGGNHGVGNGLISCTSTVTISCEFMLGGRRVTLVDTPGFDDSTISDTDILKMIALHLSMTYQQGFKVSGIIYMHRISDFKMGGISRRNFNMFRKLCGDETLRNVLIVTNMWGAVDRELAETRERELATDERLFKPVLEKGARMVRHYNTIETAQNIIYMMILNHPMALKIQRELVDQGKDITETDAGVELDRELAALAKKHKEELAEIQKDMTEALAAKDEETQKELESVRQELKSNIDNINNDRERLSREYADEKKRADEQMAQVLANLEAEKKASEERQQRLEKMEKEYSDHREMNEEQQRALREQIEQVRREAAKRPRGFFQRLGAALDGLF